MLDEIKVLLFLWIMGTALISVAHILCLPFGIELWGVLAPGVYYR